jgi:hypothetical protein
MDVSPSSVGKGRGKIYTGRPYRKSPREEVFPLHFLPDDGDRSSFRNIVCFIPETVGNIQKNNDELKNFTYASSGVTYFRLLTDPEMGSFL